MGVSWTEEQQKVIDLRDRNILVSAAAGSGKTAVLVERIISKITDESKPVDIDRLLIVTFTKAAAAEMRERISAAIEKKVEEQPDSVHLQRQSTLIHNAQITTIHSFCLFVIRNYFHMIDLDPSFRMADEGEIKLLKSDVAEQLIESSYESKDPAFYEFVESFATGKRDDELESYILQLYEFAMSYPWPQEWLQECKKTYEVKTMEDLNESLWMKQLIDTVHLYLKDLIQEVDAALSLALSEDGPYMYEEALQDDKQLLMNLLSLSTYEELYEAMGQVKHATLSRKKDPVVSDSKRERTKKIRDDLKDTLKKKIKEQYFYAPGAEVLSDMINSGRTIRVFIDLTIRFMEEFHAKKAEKNILDFTDLEHNALHILVKHDEGKIQYSEAAKQLADLFDEVLIDEYQDSNLVQETILTSVSKISKNKKNVFMVGDVKQSIYRFRLARPELFMEKYETYETKDSQCQRIDLHKNFRSRAEVLAGVNYIFDQIMAKYLGNVEYNEEAALYPGASFPAGNDQEFTATEVLLIDMEDEKGEEVEETARELEARAIGNRMKEIVNQELVLDKVSGEYRKARYNDMVILLRTITGWADTFATVLGNMGIPAYSTSSTGYFSTVEVQHVLSLLQLMDNPNQEIALAAVLRSPMVGLVGEELAKIRSDYGNLTFYDACFLYAEEGKEEELRGKVKRFLVQLEGFRKKVPYTPMHELLFHILDETGYSDYLAAMPAGKKRRANIEMLVEKAIAYEATSYRGLFNFIRYIEQLQKYDVDFGEASTIGENEDTVRIMSIHKSKGLEFPIVFASGMGKTFNTQDSRAKLSLHPELGVATNYVDSKLRVQSPTLLKKVIQRQLALENLGEELRVLYVAFTRAKEKLILTGTMKKLGDKLKKWSVVQEQEQQKLSFHLLSGAGTYWDWILPSLMRHPAFTEIFEAYEMDPNVRNKKLYTSSVPYHIQMIPLMELVEDEVITQVEGELTKETLMSIDPDIIYSEKAREVLHAHLQEQYPYEEDKDIVSKVTVSELKRRGQNIDEEGSENLYEEPEMVPFIPDFIDATKEVAGATRGTAYHRILQLLEFGTKLKKEEVKQAIEDFVKARKISREMADLVYIPSIVSFLSSEIASRMNQAAKRGDLYREQQFVIGIDADTVDNKWSKEETVLIQGIIDAYFYEEDEIILVDYKTDFVSPGKEQELIEKYRVQLNYYAKALENITGKKVKEKIIYSFSLRRSLVFS